MPDAQLTNSHSPRQAVRPRCPVCEARMDVLRVVPGRTGYEHRTLRCTRCSLVCEAQAPSDPIDSAAQGWIHSELQPPR